jgi:hypothetical protein
MGLNAQTSVPKFTIGDVLTAANTNLLTNAPPVFSGTATRDAAFGGAGEKTLAEGQLAYLEDSNIVQYYDGAAWLAVNGKIAQVLSTTKTDTYTDASATGTLTTITGLSVTITPSSNTSKILVQATINYGANGGNRLILAFTGGNSSTAYIGDAAGTRRRVATGAQTIDANDVVPVTMMFLDSPATTSATTYAVQAADIAGGGLFINRSSTDTNGTNFARYASTITVMEVLA